MLLFEAQIKIFEEKQFLCFLFGELQFVLNREKLSDQKDRFKKKMIIMISNKSQIFIFISHSQIKESWKIKENLTKPYYENILLNTLSL